MFPTNNIGLNDASVVLHGIEKLALILGVTIVVSLLLRKKDFIPPKYKNLILLLVGSWVLAISFQYVVSTYNYVDTFRPMYKNLERHKILICSREAF